MFMRISGTTMMMWLQSCPTCCSQPVLPACVVAAFKGRPQDACLRHPGGHVGHLHQTRQTLAHLLFLLTPRRLPCLPLTVLTLATFEDFRPTSLENVFSRWYVGGWSPPLSSIFFLSFSLQFENEVSVGSSAALLFKCVELTSKQMMMMMIMMVMHRWFDTMKRLEGEVNNLLDYLMYLLYQLRKRTNKWLNVVFVVLTSMRLRKHQGAIKINDEQTSGILWRPSTEALGPRSLLHIFMAAIIRPYFSSENGRVNRKSRSSDVLRRVNKLFTATDNESFFCSNAYRLWGQWPLSGLIDGKT